MAKTDLEDPAFWLREYQASRKRQANFRVIADKTYDRYENERYNASIVDVSRDPRTNILWANSQVEKPAYYSRIPKVVTKVKYADDDPIVANAATILEDVTCFTVEGEPDFDNTMNDAVQDFMLAGRGVGRVRYESETEIEVVKMPILPQQTPDGQPVYLDAKGQPVDPAIIQQDEDGSLFVPTEIEDVISEEVEFEYVPYDSFNYSANRCWDKVWWISFDSYLSRFDVEKEFGKQFANKLTYDVAPKRDDIAPNQSEAEIRNDKALIVEIWDKRSKKVRYFSPNSPDQFLRVDDDPLALYEFFPCPKPIIANKTTRSLMGRPSFVYYEAHVNELDRVCAKRYLLLDALRVAGVYDQSMGEQLSNVFKQRQNMLIPVSWPQWAGAGGMKGVMEFLPMADVVAQIQQLYQSEQEILARIYEISGTSDIMRGANNPNATATSEQIKGQFATLRIAEKQKEVQRFARDLINLAAEIIAEKFSDKSLQTISGKRFKDFEQVQLFMASVSLLRQDGLRRISIDIETDSTIATDEALEKQQLSEYLSSVGGLMQTAIPFMQSFPSFAGFFGELLLKTSRTFRLGRNLEGALESGIEQLKQQLQQQIEAQQQAASQPPPPDPAVVKAQTDLQIASERNQKDIAIAQAQLQQQYDIEMQRLGNDRETTAADIAVKAQKIQQEFDFKMAQLGTSEIDRTITALSRKPPPKEK